MELGAESTKDQQVVTLRIGLNFGKKIILTVAVGLFCSRQLLIKIGNWPILLRL